MKKLTPKDVLGNGLQIGNFAQMESKRHAITEPFDKAFRPIDVNHFGDIFLKCMGQINSIKKMGVEEPAQTQRVVKQRLGFRTFPRDYHGKPSGSKMPCGNAKYANQMQIFGMLHPEHITLTCKRAKREMMQDFYDVKEKFVMKFHNMKVLAMDYINNEIAVADAHTIGAKRPTHQKYNYEELGFLLLNSRVVPKANIMLSFTDRDSFFSPYEASVDACTGSHYGKVKHNVLTFDIFIQELKPSTNIFEDPEYDMTKICTVVVDNNSYTADPVKVTAYNVQFDGIDLLGMTKALADEYDTFYDEFNEAVEEVKMKYHGEFLLHEICTTDGAI
jgi:hypothetical protein